MMRSVLTRVQIHMVALMCAAAPAASAFAQAPSYQPPRSGATVRDYVVGPNDVLTITSPDDRTLSGRFTVEADHTFTYPLVGRVRAGGLTLRDVEATIEQQLLDGGFFKNPQILVAIEQYRSQKVFVVGEVRAPGAYALSGDMRLAEALALAGSTLPTASGEAVIVPSGDTSMLVSSKLGTSAVNAGPDAAAPEAAEASVIRVNLTELQQGVISHNQPLQPGDTIFVLRAESIYVLGQVKNPGTYALPQGTATMLQALALAGGVTDRGATSRLEVVRTVDGKPKKERVTLDDELRPGDTVVVPARFF